MSQKLSNKQIFCCFRGAATNGERMLPFQTAPLAAPLRSRAIIVPITLAYQSVDEQPVSRPTVTWFIVTTICPMLPTFGSLGLRRIEARVTIRPKIDCSRYEDNSAGRKRLAEDCYNRILGRVKKGYAREEDEEADGTRMDG